MLDVQDETIPVEPWRLGFYVHLTTDLYHAVDWQIENTENGLSATTTTFRCGSGTVRQRGKLSVRVWRRESGLSWQAQVTFANAADRIKGVRAVLSPVPAQRVIDASGHSEEIQPFRVLRYVYPSVASAEPGPKVVPRAGNIPLQLITLAGKTDSPIACLRATEFPPRMKWFGVTAGTDGAIIDLFTEELAIRWRNEYESPICTFESETTWDAVLEAEARTLEERTGLVPFEMRTDVPEWARRIALVVNFECIGYFGEVNQTFEQMRDRLSALARRFPPEHCLVTLWGWGGRFDLDLPYQAPAAALGGPEGFARLLTDGHAQGYRFMPVGNIQGIGAARLRELGPGLASDRITDRDGRPLAFYVDWDRDGVAEASVHYFSPDGQGWRDLLLAGIDDLVRTFAIDGYFLDQTNSFFNDPAHDHYRGVSRVIDAIRHRHPDLLLAGEGLNDYLTALTPFGTVSRKNKAEGAPETRLADRLYQRYVRRFGQLLFSAEGRWGVFPRWLSPAPVDAENPKQVESDAATTAARQYQSSWLEAGILPTLALVNHTVDLDHPGVAEVLACAERYRATCL